MPREHSFARFSASVTVEIRPAIEADLPTLEWWGWFAEQRTIIRDAFLAQARGKTLFLVAAAGGFPVGQAWVDLARYPGRRRAVIWAVRVIPGLRGLGIGTRLIATGERLAAARGSEVIEISVEKADPALRALYERLGYRLAGELRDAYRYVDTAGAARAIPLDQWVLEKPLASGAPTEAAISAR